MSPTARPLYARFPGNPVAKPPCRMINANMYGFFIKGETGTIQTYLDETLNCVPDATGNYEC